MAASGWEAGGVAEGSLVWTPDGPCPVEQLRADDALLGFDPAAFARVPLRLARNEAREAALVWLLVGGRLATVAATQPCLVFDVEGRWRAARADTLQPGDWLPVDRQVPTPERPIALPGGDAALSARLDEDALALVDALFERDKYFAEMAKRRGRIHLFELSGFLLGGASLLGDALALDEAEPAVLEHYRAALAQSFGASDDAPALARRLRRWLGPGLLPAAQRALPGWVWQVESQSRAAFLRGFFDACGAVTQDAVSVEHPSARLLVGVQALLGTVGVEGELGLAPSAAVPLVLTIRNVRRFAEWIGSNVRHKEAVLKLVYRREPRYPSDGTAILPLNRVRPALARIRAAHALPRRTTDTVDEQEAAQVSTLRLLATAFHDAPLREIVNQQLYLEPVSAVLPAGQGTVHFLVLPPPACLVSNGVVLLGQQAGGS